MQFQNLDSSSASEACSSALYSTKRGGVRLGKHINLKHAIYDKDQRGDMINCKNCGEQFGSKRNLINHRKSNQSNTVAPCRNNILGKCPFTDEMKGFRKKDLTV